jgi:NAD(P)-dependent dehydrogenase (short-subunit alcohol dehydrogenase family)
VPIAILTLPQPEFFAAVRAALDDAGFGDAPPATLLVQQSQDAAAIIATARDFAGAVPDDAEALVINILPRSTLTDWPAYQSAALLWAFTRHAALAWAPRRIRVNAIAFGEVPSLHDQPAEDAGRAAGPAPAAPATPEDLAATVLAIWQFPSMTGQVIRLAT